MQSNGVVDMAMQRIPHFLAITAVMALLIIGCSSDGTTGVVETGASSDSATAVESPEPTTTPSVEEHSQADDPSTQDSKDEPSTRTEEQDAGHAHQTAEPESVNHAEEQKAPPAQDEDAAAQPPEDGVVRIVMNEFGYITGETEFPAGSPITFEFINEGAIEHEAMFGTPHQQEEFHSDAGHSHGDTGHHGEVIAITLAAGESGTLTVTFAEPGKMIIGCHLPGHWDAGMATALTIV